MLNRVACPVAVVLLICGSTWVTAQTVPPPTLNGETFFSTPVERLASHCDVSGGNSWFVYKTKGTAKGPYAGPFTEHGYVEIGPQQFNPPFLTPGPIVRWHAEFTISSPAGRVVGHKKLPPGTNFTGLCLDTGNPAYITEYAAYTSLQYDAVIKLDSEGEGEDAEHKNGNDGGDADHRGKENHGRYADHGSAYSQVFVPYPASPPTSLYQAFTSSQNNTTPIGDDD